MTKVVVYIDGFNLYHGLRSGWGDSLWLNVPAMARKLLIPGQILAGVKYFTARERNPPDRVHRQNTYIEALEAQTGLSIYFGRY